ncbi:MULTISPECIES: galactokinase [Hydrogenibacillus]|uniref:Galactokinase n=2 Tax=Hydrogenibacillus schlegelii TaxID=1484 RepID=A0A2T5G9C9_HYDSH|nr:MULTISPECIES: galactokinase [Hydrogenibacillus]PTQ52787.1 MAG: Galactokinase [Hydrogenibacillus schlegelii]QZA33257.1 galactokinase [Hydrogenibacillus sp. N12]
MKRIFFAPGRINLIGEHTDTTGGLVMPAAIDAGTTGVVNVHNGETITFVSRSFPGRLQIDRRALKHGEVRVVDRSDDGWGEYVRGAIIAWLEVASAAGRPIADLPGMNVELVSDLPVGAGLSSSASLTVLIALIFDTFGQTALGPEHWAKIGQRAENETVGVACGLMDHFAASYGKQNHALFLDTHTLAYEWIPFSPEPYVLVVIDSGKRRSLRHSAYNDRLNEVEQALSWIRRHRPTLTHLGALRPEEWAAIRPLLPESAPLRRVDHIVAENDRVLKARDALRSGDLRTFAALLTATHRSLQSLFEVTRPEIDALVELLLKAPGVLGARMMGAGFGGSVLALVHRDQGPALIADVGPRYRHLTGLEAKFYRFSLGDGARERT